MNWSADFSGWNEALFPPPTQSRLHNNAGLIVSGSHGGLILLFAVHNFINLVTLARQGARRSGRGASFFLAPSRLRAHHRGSSRGRSLVYADARQLLGVAIRRVGFAVPNALSLRTSGARFLILARHPSLLGWVAFAAAFSLLRGSLPGLLLSVFDR